MSQTPAPDENNGSISFWIHQLQQGDEREAAERLWQRFHLRLVSLGRDRLRGAKRRVADEEDLAAIAFQSFFTAARQGRFPKLNDRGDLWQVLFLLVDRKAADIVRRERAGRRGGGGVRGESVFMTVSNDRAGGLDQCPAAEPTPEFAAEVAESCRQLLTALNDDVQRRLVVLKMEGYENGEIAELLNVSERTVERKLALVRATWSQWINDEKCSGED